MVNGNREGDATAKQERTGQSKRALVQKPLYREGDTTAPCDGCKVLHTVTFCCSLTLLKTTGGVCPCLTPTTFAPQRSSGACLLAAPFLSTHHIFPQKEHLKRPPVHTILIISTLTALQSLCRNINTASYQVIVQVERRRSESSCGFRTQSQSHISYEQAQGCARGCARRSEMRSSFGLSPSRASSIASPLTPAAVARARSCLTVSSSSSDCNPCARPCPQDLQLPERIERLGLERDAELRRESLPQHAKGEHQLEDVEAPAENAPFFAFSAFPMFVPSLSWQNDRSSTLQKGVFVPHQVMPNG
jgi:hypothetical protein